MNKKSAAERKLNKISTYVSGLLGFSDNAKETINLNGVDYIPKRFFVKIAKLLNEKRHGT